jgi:hypothetical protein
LSDTTRSGIRYNIFICFYYDYSFFDAE